MGFTTLTGFCKLAFWADRESYHPPEWPRRPLPSSLDWGALTAAQRPGVGAALYLYQSTGQYAGTYRTYVNGMGGSPIINVGAGYFVRVATPGIPGPLNLTNDNRVTIFAGQPTFGCLAADTRPQLHLRLSRAGLADDAFFYLKAGATPAVDALKLANPSGLDLATTS